MSYLSKNPAFKTTILDDVGIAGSVSNPPASKHKIVNRGGQLKMRDSSGNETAMGGGSGELNLVTNGSDSANWSTTGANGPVASTTTTAGDLPLGAQVSTAIKFTSATAAGAEASHYSAITLTPGEALKNKKHKVDLWIRPGTNFLGSEWTVSIYSGATRMSLSTDASGVTYLPNATGKFTTTFDADSSTTYTLRFSRPVNAGSNAAVLNVAGIVAGPGIQPQGAVVGPWVDYTPTIGGLGSGVATGNVGKYRRIGDSLELRAVFNVPATAGTGSSDVTISIPSGLTIDSTKLNAGISGDERNNIGTWEFYNGATFSAAFVSITRSTTTIAALKSGVAALLHGSDIVAGSEIAAWAFLPIAEWASSGTTNLAQNDVEYAFNTSTSDANDTTSFGYGPAGTPVVGALTTERLKTVNFQTPIQATDKLVLELQKNSTGQWVDVGDATYLDGIGAFQYQNGVTYGIGLDTSGAIGTTTVKVVFGRYAYANGATYGAAGQAWSAGGPAANRWRVRKVSGGNAVGFGDASATASGLINTTTQVFAGVKTFNSGVALPTSGGTAATLNFYEESYTHSTTFTFNGTGGGTSSSVDLKLSRVGNMVTCMIPNVTATSGTTSTDFHMNTALPTRFRPSVNSAAVCHVRNNGAATTTPGLLSIETSGLLVFYRDQLETAWTNSTTCGTGYRMFFSWLV